ncbi:MAG: GNAT family N-acetyltransferase [Gammaproteobacteria bacterium]|nr:GNAT family N-acetyltransferase [Gammaproteobacteria bacterium]
MSDLNIRPSTKGDVGLVLGFIHELAEYEKLAHEVEATEEQLRENLFGQHPQAEVLVAEWQEEPVGFALFFHNFSTFRGVRGLYLEDLYVQVDHRGKGIGKAMLKELAAIAVERGCARFEWSVLDWNRPAIEFYEAMGARLMTDWRTCRIDDDALRALASRQ